MVKKESLWMREYRKDPIKREEHNRQSREYSRRKSLDPIWVEKRRTRQRLYMRKLRKNRTPKEKEEFREKERHWALKSKLTVFQHFGNKCKCCGEKDIRFLSRDHVNNDGNVWRKKHGGVPSGYKTDLWIIRNNFPKEIQILCYNCNLGKAHNKGICPHKDKIKK